MSETLFAFPYLPWWAWSMFVTAYFLGIFVRWAEEAWRYCRRFDSRMATLRGMYWWLIRRYERELCQRCGRPVRLCYHAPDWIWEAVTGRARKPSGEAASGILCPRCLSDLAKDRGLSFLRWTCSTTDEVMYG